MQKKQLLVHTYIQHTHLILQTNVEGLFSRLSNFSFRRSALPSLETITELCFANGVPTAGNLWITVLVDILTSFLSFTLSFCHSLSLRVLSVSDFLILFPICPSGVCLFPTYTKHMPLLVAFRVLFCRPVRSLSLCVCVVASSSFSFPPPK